MLNEEECFKFEDRSVDFPFYKNMEFFREKTGLILLTSLLIFIFLIFGPIQFYDYQEQVILTFVMLIPFLYVSKGKLGTLFRKPKREDIRTVILCSLAYFAYVFIISFIGVILEFLLGINIIASPHIVSDSLNWIYIIFQFIQIIGEELFRAILFLSCLTFLYKYTNDRKHSIVLSAIIALIAFGLMHLNSYPNIVYCLIMMGLGTFFEFYPYLKTKNVFLSILVHFIINILISLIHLI